MTATTYKTSPNKWLKDHRAAYHAALEDYKTHPAYAAEEPATQESMAYLYATLHTLHRHAYDEHGAAQICTEVYAALGQMALSIRVCLGTAYREDALYQRINAMRPAMVRAGVVLSFI